MASGSAAHGGAETQSRFSINVGPDRIVVRPRTLDEIRADRSDRITAIPKRS